MSGEDMDPEMSQGMDQEIDAGEPIRQLAKFEHPASAGLLGRIRRTIQRRSTVAQLTSFSGGAPLLVLREFWLMLVEQLGPKRGKDVTRGENS